MQIFSLIKGGRVHKSKIKQISLAVCLAFIPLCGFSAGLGKLNINSGLGEPLRAEVELLSVTPDELSTLAASIAPEEAYAVQGITRLGIHNNIKVDLAKNIDGSPVLKLHSSQPISDPYLDVLIQVDWASGRLLREYTVLLDPPGYKNSINEASSTTVLPPSVANVGKVKAADAENANAINSAQTVTQKSQKSKKVSSQSVAQVDESGATTNTPQLMTVRGDTLSSIAKEMQIEGVSLDQMLVGLFENNQEAFTNKNMNRLKVGQIIKAPSKDTLVAIDSRQAKQTIKVHSANWNQYRNSLAGAVVETQVAEDDEQKQSASGKIATAEDKALPIKSGPQDVVKLSAGEKDNGQKPQDFDAKILALQEEATARENALKESQQRMATLEKQIEDMQKLLALKNQAMTDLQQNAQQVVGQTEANQATVKPPAQETKPAPSVVSPVTPVTPEPEPTFMDNLPDGVDITMLGGAAGVALLGAGWMFLRNKRRKDLDSFERGILTSGGLRANTVFGNTTGNASTSDTSFLTDFAQSADGSMIDTNDVDPIAEAEVYMAYGRDAQAEEILKDAISKEPKRYELHLKLLEMYAGRKDVSAFEAIAGELYTTLGANDPTWSKVAEMGAKVEPDNPLYNVNQVTESSVEAAMAELDVADFDDVAVSTDEGLDFSLDDDLVGNSEPEVDEAGSAVLQSFSVTPGADNKDAFDMGSIDDSVSDELAATDNLFEEGSISDTSIEDIEQEIGGGDQPVVAEGNLSNKNILDDNSLDFDLAGFSESKDAAVDSSAVESISHLPSLDLTSVEEDIPVAELDLSTSSNSVDTDKVESGFDFDLSNQEAPESDVIAEEISFDLPAIDESTANLEADATLTTSESDANAFDFSAISLDLSDEDALTAVDEATAESSVKPDVASAAAENQDVDIKLDLVAAYIDMDDKEGARELLEEVAKEGGPQQRQRAEQLLASLA